MDIKNKAIKKKPKTKKKVLKQLFNFPSLGVTIEATSYEEALILLNLKNNDL